MDLRSYLALDSSCLHRPDWIRAQERHPHCGKLKLRDWLLRVTIVQRCPRYVLLLRELMSVERREKEGEGEWDRLGKVLALIEKGASGRFYHF